MPSFSIDPKQYLNVTDQPLSGGSLLNWFRLLTQNHFHIDWRFIPRAFFVTAMTAILAPFRFYEHKKYNQLLQQVTVEEPVFIIGHFRSGTTFLHYLLGQDPNLGYVSTFETMTPETIIANEEMFRKLVKNRLPAKRPMDDLEMQSDLPYEEEYAIANMTPYSFYHGWYFPQRWNYYFDKYVLFKNSTEKEINRWKKTYDYFLRKIAYKNNGKHILLKSIVNTARIKPLLEMYPNARFIHIHRNPYQVYKSTWKLYRRILPIFSFQHIDSPTLDSYILETYQKLYTKYLSDKHLIPQKNLVEFSFDSFIKKPVDILKSTYNHLRLNQFNQAKPYFQKYFNKHEDYKASTYSFTDEEKQKIYSHWKSMFEAYQYPREL